MHEKLSARKMRNERPVVRAKQLRRDAALLSPFLSLGEKQLSLRKLYVTKRCRNAWQYLVENNAVTRTHVRKTHA